MEHELSLPSLSEEHASLSRLISEHQHSVTAQLNGKSWQLSVEGVTDSAGSVDACLGLSLDNELIQFDAHHQVFDQLFPEQMPCQLAMSLPPDLQQAALEQYLQPLLDELSAQFQVPLYFQSLQPAQTDSDTIRLKVTAHSDDATHRLYFHVDSTLQQLLAQLPRSEFQPTIDTPLFTQLLIGRARLAASMLAELNRGDIVFFDEHVTGSQILVQPSPSTRFMGTVEGTQITIENKVPVMDEYEEGIDTSELEFELLFEIGRQEMTYEQLQQLSPGYIFELDRPIEQPVRVLVNGKCVAECQLVQVSNRLGARITNLMK